METNKVKCVKCGNEFDENDCIKTNKGYLCKFCSLKAKKKVYSIILAAILVFACAGGVFYLHSTKNRAENVKESTSMQDSKKRMNSFSGVNNIKDSMNVDAADKGTTTFSLNETMAQSAPVDVNQAVDNIEAFKSAFTGNVQKAESSNASSVVIPSIHLLFSFNKSDLDSKTIDFLKEYANAYLKTNKQATIIVDGYTCNIGGDGINNWISKQRAQNAKNELHQFGVPENKIEIHWYGKSKNSQFSYPSQSDYRRVNITIK